MPDRPTTEPTDQQHIQQTDMKVRREVTLQIILIGFRIFFTYEQPLNSNWLPGQFSGTLSEL